MRKVVKHDGIVIDSFNQLPNGQYVQVEVYTVYAIEDLPHSCYIGSEEFYRDDFVAMIIALAKYKKVMAIKLVKRCGSDWGLRESKEFVDSLIN